jgi:cysteine desulfurase / selenocysteine lyase
VGLIYFDNAATSWPKPSAVAAAIADQAREATGNPGRAGHRMSVAAGRLVERGRDALAALFNVADPSRIVFTLNGTHALNLALHGLLRPGDHVVTTSLEHNSVMRPLRHLAAQGVELSVAPCAADGSLCLDAVRGAIRPTTRVLVATHASNVTGALLPVSDLGAIAREHGALFLVDGAQTAGCVPIDVQAMGIDLLAFPGHKGLLGPAGTGGLYVRDGIALASLMQGGTGSDSAYEQQPDFLPDAHESGTVNVGGIAGLTAAALFLAATGIDVIRAHERGLVEQFLAQTADIPGLIVHGPRDAARQCGVVSFTIAGASPSEVSQLLDDSFGIMARAGLQCAPSAHRSIGTFPEGTIRFSFGWFNTAQEIETSVAALREIAAWAARGVAWTA